MSYYGSISQKTRLRDKLYSAPYYKYLSPSKQLQIENYYLEAKHNKERRNCKTMSIWANEPAICIRQHLFHKFGSEVGPIIGYGDYIHYDEYYAYFTGTNVKRSRYIMAKELGFEEFLPYYYKVHHIDLNKLNDKIRNLFLAYDVAIHNKIHTMFYESFDNKSCITFENIKEFTELCMNEKLNENSRNITLSKSDKDKLEEERKSIFRYLGLLDKLFIARNNSPVFDSL